MSDETVRGQEIEEFRNRLIWLEQDRHKLSRRLATVEQQSELQRRELDARDGRIKQLESQLIATRGKLSDIEKVDGKIGQLQAEFSRLLDEEITNRRNADAEHGRAQRVAHDLNVREIANIRTQLPAIGRLENAMEQRKTEETRLSKMLGKITNRFPAIDGRLEDLGNQVTYQMETHKKNGRDIATMQSALLEISKRWEPLESRIDMVGRKQARVEADIQELQSVQHKNLRQVNDWMEQSKLSDYERTKRVESWMELIEAYKTDMAEFHKRWSAFEAQTKEAQNAVLAIDEWRQQLERSQAELGEVTRLEIDRFKVRWEQFIDENEKFRRVFELDSEQRWAGSDRRDQQTTEAFQQIELEIAAIKKVYDVLQRVQVAQSDALKKFPTIWLEEVEKAIANDPDRRREPSRISIREE
jgi:chromosome segregation ATPase